MKAFVLSLLFVLISLFTFAQGETANNNNDIFAGHLKFYIVPAVLGLILLWLFVFMFSTERRLSQLEEKQK